MMPGGIAVVTSGFPRRSETFLLNELLALDARGTLAAVFATKAGDARKVTPAALAARARRAACVIACNRDIAAELARAGAPSRVLPHGVDTHRFRPRPEPRGVPLCLLAVGRLVEKKGFETLIEA